MADQTITCTSACTVTLQVEITTPLFNLSVEDGALITGAILVVWAVAYGFRAVLQVLNSGGNNPSEET
ncbi:hypothetical protein ACFX58_09405 [Sphingomonas sp. NCPPB 2930]